MANFGAKTNSGIELTITYNVINKSDFSWSVSLNYTTQKNMIYVLVGDGAEIAGPTWELEDANLTRVVILPVFSVWQ